MKITRVDVFEYELAYRYGLYEMSKRRSGTHQPALVVRLTTDTGLVGWGETCFLSRVHLPAFLESERAALAVLGRAVLGLDPCETGVVQSVMAASLMAGMAAKSAVDIACWDLFGKAAGMPLSTLLGGRLQERVRAWESIPLLPPEAVADYAREALAKGVLDFQIKVGNDPYEDAARVAAIMGVTGPGNLVVVDANGGWNLQNALVAAREMAGYRIYLEQPCKSLSNCAEVRRRSDLPMIIDENLGTIEDLVAIKTSVGAGGISIKPSKVGGLTPARLLRDAATELGMMVTIDDTWGGAVTSAALAHLAVSTRPDALLATTFFTEFATPLIAEVPHRQPDGCGTAPTGPGLGVEVHETYLGDAVFTIR